jgi:hypothetical protein
MEKPRGEKKGRDRRRDGERKRGKRAGEKDCRNA